MVESQPAGGRLSFVTSATVIELDALPMRRNFIGLPSRPVGVYDLLVDGVLTAQATIKGGDAVTIDMATGQATHASTPPETLRFDVLPEGEKQIDIWLPHNENAWLLELRANAPVRPVAQQGRKVWVHYGSSISQGSNAVSPTGTWPAVASLRADVGLINLGFGGSALLDPFAARTIRDLAADFISLKIGINLVNLDLMRMRAFGPAVHGFIDTIREGHPTTPLLIVSPILCPIHEDTPG
ncbi:MAG: SGNH/GDSL hydrolase family protein, partial [Lysobacter sp.]